MLSKEELAAMRARLDAATPGPWKHSPEERLSSDCVHIATVTHNRGAEEYDLLENPEDATCAFIAASRTDMGRLLDEVERLCASPLICPACGTDVGRENFEAQGTQTCAEVASLRAALDKEANTTLLMDGKRADLEAEVTRLRATLLRITTMDYRGNKPSWLELACEAAEDK